MKIKKLVSRIFSKSHSAEKAREDELTKMLWRVFDNRWTLINIRERAADGDAAEKCRRAMEARYRAEMKLYGADWQQAEKSALAALLEQRLAPEGGEEMQLLAEKLIRMAELSAKRFDSEQNIRADRAELNELVMALRQGEQPAAQSKCPLAREYLSLYKTVSCLMKDKRPTL